jgi:hypothetical protein
VIYLYFTSSVLACLAILAVLDQRKVEVVVSVWIHYFDSDKLLVTHLIGNWWRIGFIKTVSATF